MTRLFPITKELYAMLKAEVLKEIDRTVKQCWITNIVKDYKDEYLFREDALKCALYYHLRRKLDRILRENSLRIYPEYKFDKINYRADLVIAQIDENKDYSWLGEAVSDVVAIFELKFTGGKDSATRNWIKNDLWKFKNYMNYEGLKSCQFYFASIYESEWPRLNWLDARSTNHWAKGRVTELNAGLINDEMVFEIHSYNGWNEELNDL